MRDHTGSCIMKMKWKIIGVIIYVVLMTALMAADIKANSPPLDPVHQQIKEESMIQ